MDSLYLLIPIALVFVAIAVKLLLWAIDSGQYDDLDKEGWRILADEEAPDARADGSNTEDDFANAGESDDSGRSGGQP
ncbi:MAG: cbb3-type cytochrome oxidase assembly protein CcoS [Pseudohaliea sp.]